MPDTVIARRPPNDGRNWDAQCARCGSSVEFEDCSACGGEGETAPGELYEQDPLWYDPEDSEPCHQCGGTGGGLVCLSGWKWCEAHPMAGREHVALSAIEWFVVREPNAVQPDRTAPAASAAPERGFLKAASSSSPTADREDAPR